MLTIQPFLDGVEYPKESKTISILGPTSPYRPPLQDNAKHSNPRYLPAQRRRLLAV